MTVLVLERYPVDPAHLPRFDELASDRIDQMRSAPGILWAEGARTADEESGFLVIAEWRTDADAEAFRNANVLDVFDAVLVGDVTVRRFISPA